VSEKRPRRKKEPAGRSVGKKRVKIREAKERVWKKNSQALGFKRTTQGELKLGRAERRKKKKRDAQAKRENECYRGGL